MLLSDLKRMQQIVDRMDTDEISAVSGFRQMRDDLNRQDANWGSTLRYFDSVKPPSDCQAFGAAYRRLLAINASFMAGYAALCNGIDTSNRYSLYKAKQRLDDMGADPRPIHETLAAFREAKREMKALCARFSIRNPFPGAEE